MTASPSGPGPSPGDDAARAVHVLVVDREPALRRSLARGLEARGMKVGVAEDGAEGLGYVRRESPDVVLLDATMAEPAGLELVARVRAMSACELVLMTPSAELDPALAATKAGAYHFLTKPLHSQDAVAHVVGKAAAHGRLVDRARVLEQALRARDRFGEIVLAELAVLPYAEAKRRLMNHFDESYTGELLRRTGGNMSEAARHAGLDRSNFRRLLKRHRVAP